MLEALKKWGTDFVLKTEDLFTTSESQVYVKDLRKVMTYNGRKCQYPKNYDQIVESGKIMENKDMHGNSVLDKDGDPTYRLIYGEKDQDGKQPSFKLTLVKNIKEEDKKEFYYFTIDFPVPVDQLHKSYFEPLGFARLDLRKHVPIFEAEKTDDPKYPFQLTNSSVLTKKEKNKEGKVQEVVDKEGRNGELLYTSDYKKLNTSFFEVRDQSNNLELDKSLVSVPIVFAAGLAKVCAKLLTYLPMKLGEHLISKENPIAKSFGYLLFTPAVAVKNLVNIGATILKAPILLFVADEKKYGDAYWTMWKQQLKECWEEVKSDYSVVKDGKRLEPKKEDYPEHKIAGTWKELDARRPGIEKELEKGLNKSGESANKSRGPEESKKKSQNEINKQIADKNQESGAPHADRIEEERRQNSSKDKAFNYTRTN